MTTHTLTTREHSLIQAALRFAQENPLALSYHLALNDEPAETPEELNALADKINTEYTEPATMGAVQTGAAPDTVRRLASMKTYALDGEGEMGPDGEDAMRVLNFHIRAARELLGIEPDEDEEDEGCPLCSRCGCPENDHTEDCRCEGFLDESHSLPAFRPGAPVRVKVPAGHEPSAFNGERGTLVRQEGERWLVNLHNSGNTVLFHPAELTVLE